MTRLRAGLLIVAGVLLLGVGVAGTFFYIKVYKPIASPIMAMSIGKLLEDRQLQNHDFTRPDSDELGEEQVRRFVAVEEAVEAKAAATGRAALEAQQAALERAAEANELTVRATLAAFGEIKPVLMSVKPVQIETMNREHFSKAEFEWVRDQLYRAAGLRLTRVDTSQVLAGTPDPTVRVRALSEQTAPAANRQLAQPLAARLDAWRAFAFFGL